MAIHPIKAIVMPYSATVFNVLIASPSDVPSAREAIAQGLHEWNSLNSEDHSKVLLPVMWESHSAPLMGDRPQEIINKQVVRNCDILIGTFGTRIGSHTGKEESGTVEEIKYFLKQKKPVMLYFAKSQSDIDELDIDQLKRLKEFKASIRNEGIQENYSSPDDLKQKLFKHLTIIMKGVTVETSVNAKIVKEARKSITPINEDFEQNKNSSDEESIKIYDYTEKSFVLIGNSLAYKDKLKDIGGKWSSLRDGSKGWIFSKKRQEEVRDVIKSLGEMEPYD